SRSRRRSHDPSCVQRDAPAVTLQSAPFEPSSNRYGHCEPISSEQDPIVGVETAPFGVTGEISKENRADSRNAYRARGVAGPAAGGRHRQHGPVNEASTQLGDPDLLRSI